MKKEVVVMLLSLYKELHSQANENFFGDYYPYGDTEKPTLNMVYRYDAIGPYGYYEAGTANICVIPITEQVIEDFFTKRSDHAKFRGK